MLGSNSESAYKGLVHKIINKKGCRNIYLATGPHDTSYWICAWSGWVNIGNPARCEQVRDFGAGKAVVGVSERLCYGL
jgi:hypothetical protein